MGEMFCSLGVVDWLDYRGFYDPVGELGVLGEGKCFDVFVGVVKYEIMVVMVYYSCSEIGYCFECVWVLDCLAAFF
ncbi:hypothetical protein, partial [Rhizobium leguminosarum]|uniref:hypothetical protein n=1 Tax=Rhizobium leguminosarum TaxID=384 RepID=UPI003F975D10